MIKNWAICVVDLDHEIHEISINKPSTVGTEVCSVDIPSGWDVEKGPPDGGLQPGAHHRPNHRHTLRKRKLGIDESHMLYIYIHIYRLYIYYYNV